MKDPRIVVGIDGSAGSTAAVTWAAKLAATRHLELKIVHGLQMAGLYYGGGLPGASAAALFDAIKADGERILAEARQLATSVAPELAVTVAMSTDAPAPMLVDESRRARMLVVGHTGAGGFTGMLLGGTASAVVSHAHCPVAIVRGRSESSVVPDDGPVVVGIDGSRNSEQAIAVAFEEASLRGCPLVAVHAWSDVTYESFYGTVRLMPQWESMESNEERLLSQRLAGWQEKYPDVEVRRRLVRDRPRDVLLELSETAQLVVVGSHGRGGFAGMLIGSTSGALIQHAQCPVLVVRPEPEA